MNQQIATASEEQSVVAEQINRSVLNVRDVSDQTSAASEQTAASSGELEQLGRQWGGSTFKIAGAALRPIRGTSPLPQVPYYLKGK